MTTGVRVLIIEDEEQLTGMLQAMLTQEGYSITSARTGLEGLQHLVREEFGVILLDLGLPDMDGKDVIRQARAISAAPILVISARDSGKEKVSALDMGANDYLAKPFDAGELLARMRVALRPVHTPAPRPVVSRALQIDVSSRRAIVNGASVRLSRKETELVQLLAEAEGAIVSHDRIIEAIWGRGSDADLMNVRVLAWQLRRKIEPDVSAPRFLIAEAGEGYRLNLD
ncbi:MAG: response regulator transcription factor [Phenylobacterium sp.]|uniref:response regulator transcription factor n=1 Tax=Phenylobacterium sp. TaxID=1871053 RepID=UPI00122B5F83|nr:response regulator transcription factor [Phenylobacterium sp.]TAJ72486.1 MAG: response regulator transcription factor [Phenylobacterium sp.]